MICYSFYIQNIWNRIKNMLYLHFNAFSENLNIISLTTTKEKHEKNKQNACMHTHAIDGHVMCSCRCRGTDKVAREF